MRRLWPRRSPRANIEQLTKFAIVGCLNAAVSFAVFVVCYKYWQLGALLLHATGAAGTWAAHALDRLGIQAVDAAVANSAGYLVGMANSFILNKFWTFEAQGRTLLQVHRFVTLNLVGLVGSTLVMFVFVDLFRAPYIPVFVATIGLVAIFHFFGNKYWTFSDALRHECKSGRSRNPCPHAD